MKTVLLSIMCCWLCLCHGGGSISKGPDSLTAQLEQVRQRQEQLWQAEQKAVMDSASKSLELYKKLHKQQDEPLPTTFDQEALHEVKKYSEAVNTNAACLGHELSQLCEPSQPYRIHYEINSFVHQAETCALASIILRNSLYYVYQPKKTLQEVDCKELKSLIKLIHYGLRVLCNKEKETLLHTIQTDGFNNVLLQPNHTNSPIYYANQTYSTMSKDRRTIIEHAKLGTEVFKQIQQQNLPKLLPADNPLTVLKAFAHNTRVFVENLCYALNELEKKSYHLQICYELEDFKRCAHMCAATTNILCNYIDLLDSEKKDIHAVNTQELNAMLKFVKYGLIVLLQNKDKKQELLERISTEGLNNFPVDPMKMSMFVLKK